jgi:hypothetical protein
MSAPVVGSLATPYIVSPARTSDDHRPWEKTTRRPRSATVPDQRPGFARLFAAAVGVIDRVKVPSVSIRSRHVPSSA